MQFDSSRQIISWFRDRYRERSLILKPAYQRNPVWALRQKCRLIETILLELPIPEIYIQQSVLPDGSSQYAVVDGQQRIRTVLQFLGIDSDPKEISFNKFALDKLDQESEWSGLTFAELPDEVKKQFYGYSFVIRELRNASETELRDMFQRLNQYLTPAKPQELRNARYVGPFKQQALRLADNAYWSEKGIVTPASIRRMGDVEFTSELLTGVIHGPQGGSASVINLYYAQYEDYEDEYPGQRSAERLFADSLDLVQRLFPDIREHRWGNKTDFYTLFVVIAVLLSTHELPANATRKVRSALIDLAAEINVRLKNETAKVSKEAVEYVRAVEKGANDKARRGERHKVVLRVITPYFRELKTSGGAASSKS